MVEDALSVRSNSCGAVNSKYKLFQYNLDLLRVPSRKWLEFEGDVISNLFAQTESALARLRSQNKKQ